MLAKASLFSAVDEKGSEFVRDHNKLSEFHFISSIGWP